MLNDILKRYERFRPFTDDEAWGVFRLAAISEAVGWTMLIIGILIGKYITPGNDTAVQIAGHTHGALFLIYIVATLVLYPSQKWSRRKTITAAIASVPPFGSLMFEQWAAHARRDQQVKQQIAIISYKNLVSSIK